MNQKRVMLYRKDPSKKFFLISVRLSDEPGSLSQVSRVLAVRGINILESYSCSDPEKGNAIWSSFVESTDPRMNGEFVKQLLEESPFVESIEIRESKNGLIIDSLNFPVMISSESRAILVGAEVISNSFAEISRKFGTDGDNMIFELGRSYGTERVNRVFTGVTDDPRDVMEQSLLLLSGTGMGLGNVTSYDSNGPVVAISVVSSFECAGRSSPKPASNFVRGLIAGAGEAIFGREFDCREVECVATGATRCLFEARPAAV